jgi:hypothetical protein
MARYSLSRSVRSIVREVERGAKQRAKELERQRRELERESKVAERERIREEKTSAKEQAKRQKERAKEREIRLAQLEVEDYENEIDLLLSLHKESPPVVDWGLAFSRLKPFDPRKLAASARREWRRQAISDLSPTTPPAPLLVEEKESTDLVEELETWRLEQRFANAVLGGSGDAYIEVIDAFSHLDEIAAYGSEFDFVVHGKWRLEVTFTAGGPQSIPQQSKVLSASGKVSSRKVPKKVHDELYRDHICSCILRVGREVFSILPIKEVLITVHAAAFDIETASERIGPIYSVVFSRDRFLQIDFENSDPSEVTETFQHSGDFKASRKDGAFRLVPVLTFADVMPAGSDQSLTELRERVLAELETLGASASDESPESNDDDE